MIRPPVRFPALALALSACVAPRVLLEEYDAANATLQRAHTVHAIQCAPREVAEAEAARAFAEIEFAEGHLRPAQRHVDRAAEMAQLAFDRAVPCGTRDTDGDGIADVVDRCPDEKEDIDGDNDTDGCRDLEPYADQDGDGLRNIDDDCIDSPEDFDGDADDDGCPETSDDSDGDGIIDAVDGCPRQAEDLDGFKDPDGCPDPDNDSDGIPDLRDACANVPEDRDLWEDEDGCPDPDNDLDGVPDTVDRCPTQAGVRESEGCPAKDSDKDGVADNVDKCPEQPETINEYLDDDGCPDTPPSRVQVTSSRVEITEIVPFETNSARLLPEANAVLDDVVQVLKDAPEMRLRIEGHTDADGSEEFNLELSQQRAEAVKRYLVSKGISASRLEALGLGETRPIDTNRTPAGRARNRRVEFHILTP